MYKWIDFYFLLDTTEVMVGQFKQFLAKPEHESEPQPSEAFFWNLVADNSPRDEHPMVYASWNDVVAYAKWTGTNC